MSTSSEIQIKGQKVKKNSWKIFSFSVQQSSAVMSIKIVKLMLQVVNLTPRDTDYNNKSDLSGFYGLEKIF